MGGGKEKGALCFLSGDLVRALAWAVCVSRERYLWWLRLLKRRGPCRLFHGGRTVYLWRSGLGSDIPTRSDYCDPSGMWNEHENQDGVVISSFIAI